jgi:hypothetical protein
MAGVFGVAPMAGSSWRPMGRVAGQDASMSCRTEVKLLARKGYNNYLFDAVIQEVVDIGIRRY